MSEAARFRPGIALGRYLKDGRPTLLSNNQHTGALFINRNGTRLSARSVQKLVRAYAIKAAQTMNPRRLP